MNQDKHSDNHIPESVRSALKSVSLTADEKRTMRQELRESMTASEQRSNQSRQPAGWLQYVRWLSYGLGRTAMGVAAVLYMIGGVTYAAEDALPGTPLYAVKTHVNEAFINITAVGDSKTARTQSRLAARRINELQTLINNGRLTTTTSERLLHDIVEHTQIARENIASLETAGERKRQQANRLQSQLTALLAAESETLQSVASSSATTSPEGRLVQEAAHRLTTIARESTGSSTADGTNDLTQSAVTDLLSLGIERLDTLYRQYQNRYDSSETPPPQELVTAAHDLETALARIQSGDYTAGVKKLETLLKQTQRVRLTLSVGTSSDAATSSATTTNPRASSTVVDTASSSQEAVGITNTATSSSGQMTVTDNDTNTAPVPSKQNLHNQAIQEVLVSAREYVRTVAKERSQTKATTSPATHASSTAKKKDESNASSSSATSSADTQPATTTASSTQTATSSGSQQGGETGL
jgi:hypothetical protein